jgi:hypothetical protein
MVSPGRPDLISWRAPAAVTAVPMELDLVLAMMLAPSTIDEVPPAGAAIPFKSPRDPNTASRVAPEWPARPTGTLTWL